MAPFDRAYTTFYWSAIVGLNIALPTPLFPPEFNGSSSRRTGGRNCAPEQWCSQRGFGGFTPPHSHRSRFYSRKVTIIKYYNFSLTTRRTRTNCANPTMGGSPPIDTNFGRPKAHLCYRWLNSYILTSLQPGHVIMT